MKNNQGVKVQNLNNFKSSHLTTKKANYSSKKPKQYNIRNGQDTIDKYLNKKENIISYEDFIANKNPKIKSEKKQNVNKDIKVRNMSSKANNRNMNKNINNRITNQNLKVRNMSANINKRNMNNNTKNLNKMYIKDIKGNNLNFNKNISNLNKYNSKLNDKLLIKKESDLNKWIKKNIKSNQKQKQKEKIFNNDSQLEIAFKFEEKEKIDNIIELSNERIGIKILDEFKIYSLETMKLITTINDGGFNDKYIELANKDLARKSSSHIQFFKLSGNEYHLFQTIEENDNINAIIKLMNGNLV